MCARGQGGDGANDNVGGQSEKRDGNDPQDAALGAIVGLPVCQRGAETGSITESKPKLVRASDPATMPAVTATPASISIQATENCSSRMACR